MPVPCRYRTAVVPLPPRFRRSHVDATSAPRLTLTAAWQKLPWQRGRLWIIGDRRALSIDAPGALPIVRARSQHSDSQMRKASLSRTAPDKRKPASKSGTVLARQPQQRGWKTTDADEVSLRRWRGTTEIVAIEALEPDAPIFGTFRVRSGSGAFYDVEIRSLSAARKAVMTGGTRRGSCLLPCQHPAHLR